MTRKTYQVAEYANPNKPEVVTELIYYGHDLSEAETALKKARNRNPNTVNGRPVVRIIVVEA